MNIKFPIDIRNPADAVRCVCAELSARGVKNYIHYGDTVTVDINGKPTKPVVDFSTRSVRFDPIEYL